MYAADMGIITLQLQLKLSDHNQLREAVKIVIFLEARPLRGGGDKGLATKKKDFFEARKKYFFCGFP